MLQQERIIGESPIDLVVTGVLVTLEVHLVNGTALGASVVLELVVEVKVDGVVGVGGVTGASDDTRGPL